MHWLNIPKNKVKILIFTLGFIVHHILISHLIFNNIKYNIYNIYKLKIVFRTSLVESEPSVMQTD
jgi:hypothetical protein